MKHLSQKHCFGCIPANTTTFGRHWLPFVAGADLKAKHRKLSCAAYVH